jgi:hypothetical protein
MKSLQISTFVLRTAILGATTAWSGQALPGTSATAAKPSSPNGAVASSGKPIGAADGELPGILDEEAMPAFLYTDPCDTKVS